MAVDALDGTKYDHSQRSLFLVLFICMLVFYAAGLSRMIWDIAHNRTPSLVPFFVPAATTPALAVAMRRRWQLGADALWKIERKRKIITPYTSIESVRVIKSRRNGAKIFEIAASGKTHKLDVLQGDAFERELAGHIGIEKFEAS